MINKWTNLLLGALMVVFQSVGQSDFNHYQPLRSKGPVPKDFSTSTLTKIKQDNREDLESLNGNKREFFVEQITYSIDEILRSGNVTFGDTISNYIQQLGDRLIAEETDLKGKLRFYVYNSTEANAFSTRQGIVFVTTGLIAQLTSEAQLAFVLSHEIIHYREHHVLDLFEYATREKFYSYNEKARFLSNYSRENELEADRLAVKMVYDAGYRSSEINKTFDVLLYSYLPFEEMKLDKTYFNTSEMYVPEMYFDFKRNEISAKFKYNDYLMSHPNLAKRKEQITEQVGKFKDWQKQILYEDSLQFFYIRDIARFEYVLNKVYEDEPVEALYAIYILEKKYPESTFLKNYKSQAWLDIMKLTVKKERLSFSPYSSSLNRKKQRYYEGQISVLNQFITVLPKTGKLVMGLRNIYDVYQSDTTNLVAKNCYETAIRLLVKSDDFEMEKFSTRNFPETLAYLKNLKQDTASKSRLHAVEWDKYVVIENQSKGVTEDFGIDSSKFYMYGISDIIRDSSFVAKFKQSALQKGKLDKDKDEFNLMTDAEQEEVEYFKYDNEVHLKMDSMLVFQPAVFETNRTEIEVFKTFRTRDLVLREIYSNAEDLNIHVKSLSLKQLETWEAEEWNDYSLLQRSLTRAIADHENDYFVLDVPDLNAIHSRFKTGKLLFMEYHHMYSPDLNFGNVALFTVLLPVGLVYFPIAILSGHYSDWQFYVLDLQTGELALDRSYYVNEPASKHNIGSRLNGLFHQLKQVKNEY